MILKSKKGQVAIDFLASYGIAIVIMLVAISVLFLLIPSTSYIFPEQCVPAPGFACGYYSLDKTGILTISLSQAIGGTITINGAACSSQLTTNSLPQYGNTYVTDNTLFYPQGSNPGAGLAVPSGGSVILYMYCYGPNGIATSRFTGGSYSGYLVLNYTISSTNLNTTQTIASLQLQYVNSSFVPPILMYLASTWSTGISVINLATFKKSSTINLQGSFPELFGMAMSPNLKYIYAEDYGDGDTQVINTQTSQVTATIDAYGDFAFSPNGNSAYIANIIGSTPQLYTVNTGNYAIVNTINFNSRFVPSGYCSCMVLNNNNLYILGYLGTWQYGDLEVVNTISDSVTEDVNLESIDSSFESIYYLASSPSGRYIYVFGISSNNGNQEEIDVIDTSINPFQVSYTLLSSLYTTEQQSILFSPDSRSAYFDGLGSNSNPYLEVINTGTETNTIYALPPATVGADPGRMLLSQNGQILYVTGGDCPFGNCEITEINPTNGNVIGTVPFDGSFLNVT